MSGVLELAAGVIVTGFDGTALDARTRDALARVPFAGYILFARNLEDVEQTRALTGALRAGASLPPILAVDQEGGRIARLRRGVEVIPPMMALGALADVELTQNAGEQLAYDLLRAGFNLDFAPVLDLAVDARNTVIGTRAFGASPDLVAQLGMGFARGMRRAGIVPTFKHFPGHGATAFDTHLGPARLDADVQTLERRDLVPFARALQDAPAVMVAHVAVPAFDGDVPASLSRRMIIGLLRSAMHYRGVCFTDCMQMDAIARGAGTTAGVAMAIAAGADCALVSHDPQLAFEAAQHLAAQVERGEIPLQRLEQAHARVQALRATLHAPLEAGAPAPHPGIGARIAADALTLVRGTLPVERAACVAVTFGDAAAEALEIESIRAPLDPDAAARARLVTSMEGRRPVVISYRAHLYDGQARAIDALIERAPQTILVSSGEPFDIERFPRARTALAAYSGDAQAMHAAAQALFEGVPCRGRLPI